MNTQQIICFYRRKSDFKGEWRKQMKKEEVVKEICNCFDYNYSIYDDGRVVIDDGLGVDHEPTTEWLNNDFCGHIEYQSIDAMLLDWLEELKNGNKENVFLEEIEFIEQNCGV